MKLKKLNLTALMICLIVFNAFAQEETKEKNQEKANELNEKAISLLSETVAEIDTLRSAENRITFRTQAAGLMWNHDAVEGERMFGAVADDFANLLSQYNSTVNSFGEIESRSQIYRSRNSSSPKAKAINRLRTAMTVRIVMAETIAQYDSELAYDFAVRTNSLITNKAFRNNLDHQDERIVMRIINALNVNDLDKFIAFGRKSVKDKFRYSHLDLLKKIIQKDKDKGLEFADELLDAVKSQTKERAIDSFTAGLVLEYGVENLRDSKKNTSVTQVFDRNSLKEFAEVFTDTLIRTVEEVKGGAMLYEYYPKILEVSPSAASRLKATYRDILNDKEINKYSTNSERMKDAAKDAMEKAGDKMKEAGDKMKDAAKDAMEKAGDEMKEAGFEEETELEKKSVDGKLSEEQKDKLIKAIDEINSKTDNPKEKMLTWMRFAIQVKQRGDQTFASELMNEASLLVNQQPENYEDFLSIWMLAGGYSEIDAEKSFILLENTVYQLNDTIAAFVKVGKFMDLAGEIISENEVQVGGFEGRLIKDMLKSLKNSDKVLGNLAKADMNRTKALTDRFDRTEVRVLAKMLILTSILDKKRIDSVNSK